MSTSTELHDTLLSIASTCAAARYSHHATEAQTGPLTFAVWLREMCAAASRANCGICWAFPGAPCVCTGTPDAPVSGYHAGRFDRAHRRGLVDADELAALTAGLLPAAVVWDNGDTPREMTSC